MAIGSGGRKKDLIDLVPSPVRTGLMFGDAGMVTPCLLVLQLWVLGQGVGNEDLSCPGPVPAPSAVSGLPGHFVPTLLLVPWAGPLCWTLNWGCESGCSQGSSGGSCRETSWRGWVWTATKLPSCWLLEGWNFRPRRCRGYLLTLIVGLSLSWRSAWGAAGYQHADAAASPTLNFSWFCCLLCDFNKLFFSPASGA